MMSMAMVQAATGADREASLLSRPWPPALTPLEVQWARIDAVYTGEARKRQQGEKRQHQLHERIISRKNVRSNSAFRAKISKCRRIGDR
jgi:hypothetical protein